ncbi:hypothetical protein KEM52_005433 [Ascosphaera acerosa]|nr:hypothetical protein KEM52_005433 [Ascosphaera acerosa]
MDNTTETLGDASCRVRTVTATVAVTDGWSDGADEGSHEQAAFTVHGTVQGVFFRQFTKERAKQYGLVGWVRNESDGTVVGEVQGPEENVRKLLDELKQGPPYARVQGVNHERVAVTENEEVDFVIIRKNAL